MHFAILEDEKQLMIELCLKIKEWKPNNLDVKVSTFYTGEELLHHYRVEQIEFDIIFADIKLGGISGMETAKQLRKLGYNNAIVFTTTYTEFNVMQQSYEVSPLNYFEKPISVENIEACVRQLTPVKNYSYSVNGKEIIIPYNEIIFFEGSKNYVKIFTLNTNDKPYKQRAQLKTIVGQSPSTFMQCHRSYIINLTHIIIIKDKSLFLRTLPNKPIPIGDTYLEDVFTKFEKI